MVLQQSLRLMKITKIIHRQRAALTILGPALLTLRSPADPPTAPTEPLRGVIRKGYFSNYLCRGINIDFPFSILPKWSFFNLYTPT